MVRLSHAHPDAQGPLLDSLNQCARELLLAQSSDWAFIMANATTVPYAQRRTRGHVHRFSVLCDQIESGRPNPETTAAFHELSPVFPRVDYRDWA